LRPPPHKQEAKIFPRLSFSYSYYQYSTFVNLCKV